MAASTNVAQPIQPFKVLIASDANAAMRHLPEKAAQTALFGVPCQIDAASGFIIECAAIVSAATALIAGFSAEFFHNLSASGVAKTLTQGSVQNQPAAFPIPIGAQPSDGTMGFHLAIDSTIFVGVVGNSTTAALAVIAQTDIGKLYGLTKDAGNGFWYVDNGISTVAAGACVQITDLIDPVGTLNGRYGFKVLHAAQQLSGN